MKKTTKTTKTPAPATKVTAPAPAPKTAAPAAAKKSTVAPKIKAPSAPAPETPVVVTKPKASSVTIVAKIDVGFGNTLFLRGDAPSLSWDKGVELSNGGNDHWELVLHGIDRPFHFKLLVNDGIWSAGDDFTASPGDTLTLTPSF